MLEVQESTLDMAGQNRLDQIRASLHGTPVAGEVTAGQPASAPAPAEPQATRPIQQPGTN